MENTNKRGTLLLQKSIDRCLENDPLIEFLKQVGSTVQKTGVIPKNKKAKRQFREAKKRRDSEGQMLPILEISEIHKDNRHNESELGGFNDFMGLELSINAGNKVLSNILHQKSQSEQNSSNNENKIRPLTFSRDLQQETSKNLDEEIVDHEIPEVNVDQIVFVEKPIKNFELPKISPESPDRPKNLASIQRLVGTFRASSQNNESIYILSDITKSSNAKKDVKRLPPQCPLRKEKHNENDENVFLANLPKKHKKKKIGDFEQILSR